MPTVLFESEELLVIDKPVGLIVHSDGRTVEPTLADWILEHYPALATVGEPWVSPQGERVILPGIVHRLDRTTSGVVVIAKTPECYATLKQAFKERRVEKSYRAYVYGHMDAEEGKIVAEIMRTSAVPKRWYARPCEETDKRAAITRWELIKNFEREGEPVAEVEAHPLTGRTHQIRVHFASIGHSLIADHLYAPEGSSSLGFKRPALHAHSITLEISGKSQTFTAPPPPDFPNLY